MRESSCGGGFSLFSCKTIKRIDETCYQSSPISLVMIHGVVPEANEKLNV